MAQKNSQSLKNFEKDLFTAADRLRKNMDAAEYKHVVLGLVFLKYISDSFEVLHAKLATNSDEYANADPEDPEEYSAEGVFWVPATARWSFLHAHAKLPNIGRLIDEAMLAIEQNNPSLRGILPKEYARDRLDPRDLGSLLDLIGDIALGDEAAKSKDILGRVYEYFLGEFASLEGKKGGQFYTPKSIVKLLVEMLEPYKGRVYDPCCGSGGMFVMSEEFVQQHSGRLDDLAIYGQESNQTTYQLSRMNLAIRGIDGTGIAWNNEGTLLRDAHPDLRADYIIANPPFNQSEWGQEILRSDARWEYGVPPAGNANFAWMQHMIHHLAPGGTMGLVLANGSLSSNQSGEGDIRRKIVEADLVDCVVALPKQLFYNTGIPACLWFLSKKRLGLNAGRKRGGEILFVDASELGFMADRTHREFTDEDIARIADTYHRWRQPDGDYEDIKGFCKSATPAEVEKHGYVLTPGRYVGIPDAEDDGVSFEEKMSALVSTLAEQMAREKGLDEEIRRQLGKIGFSL